MNPFILLSKFCETGIPSVITLPQLTRHGQCPLCLTLHRLIFIPSPVALHHNHLRSAHMAYPAVTLTSHLPIDLLYPMTPDLSRVKPTSVWTPSSYSSSTWLLSQPLQMSQMDYSLLFTQLWLHNYFCCYIFFFFFTSGYLCRPKAISSKI